MKRNRVKFFLTPEEIIKQQDLIIRRARIQIKKARKQKAENLLAEIAKKFNVKVADVDMEFIEKLSLCDAANEMSQDKNFKYQARKGELEVIGTNEGLLNGNAADYFLPTTIPIFPNSFYGFNNRVGVEVGVNGDDSVDCFFAYLKLQFGDTGQSTDRLYFNPIFENNKLVGVEILAQSLGAGCLINALEFATGKMREEIAKSGADDAMAVV